MKVLQGILAFTLLGVISIQAQDIKPSEVKTAMKKVANWQIEHFRDTYSGREKPHHPLDWTNAALYVGMVKLAAIDDDE